VCVHEEEEEGGIFKRIIKDLMDFVGGDIYQS